jgi:MinD superfamily P-loop ATPase
MREVVVISGKGGTGKTSIAASFAALAGGAVLADCDVDAADLHLVMAPDDRRVQKFISGREAVIRQADCAQCGTCFAECRFEAVRWTGRNGNGRSYRIDPLSCEGCGVCVEFCPEQAIDFPERVCGEWILSETRFGPMVHARLAIAAENSGKLVSIVRREARRIADECTSRWIIVDGPPGIGCPVIASVTGASVVLVVTEPTLTGEHDMERVLRLARHFGIPALVCVNKWDINMEMMRRVEAKAESMGAGIAGRVCYDPAVTAAQVDGVTVVEYGGRAAEDIRRIWTRIERYEDHNRFTC